MSHNNRRRRKVGIHWGRLAWLSVLVIVALVHLHSIETTLLLLGGIEIK